MRDREFIFQASMRYLLLLAAVTVASLVVIFALSIAIIFKICLCICVLFYITKVINQQVLKRSTTAIMAIRSLSDGKWLLLTNAKSYKGKLLGDSTVTSFVTVLRFKCENILWPIACVIFPDALPKDFYRQLLVLLKTEYKSREG